MREYSKLGDYLSPPVGIKPPKGPNSGFAFTEVPLADWLQIVSLCGLIEHTGFTFTQRNGIGRMTAKCDAVLASGRFAMMAIIRMFFRGGLTGFA